MRLGSGGALGAIVAMGLLACTSFGSSDPSSPTAADGGTEGSTEGGADSAAEGAADAGATASLLEGGDFEVPGCLGWDANGSTLAEDTNAHGGKRSCLVCGTGGSVWSISQRSGTGLPAGSYVGEAWVRSAPSKTVAMTMLAGIETFNASDMRLDGRELPGPALTDAWQKITTSFKVGEGDFVQLDILSRAPGGCFLVDDAVLYRAL
jgi:hypothetical protein